jgi:PRC-barrel domain protein
MEQHERHQRDAAGVGPYAKERERLVSLSSLGSWRVAEGDPDIRGWEVRTVSGRQLGVVSDLLIDSDAGEVVMLDVDLPGTDRHTFVPIRVVQIDRVRRLALMDSADFPESDLTRTERGPIERQSDTPARSIHYPDVDRPMLADRAPPIAPGDPDVISDRPSDLSGSERRQAERRRIDRLSTDI